MPLTVETVGHLSVRQGMQAGSCGEIPNDWRGIGIPPRWVLNVGLSTKTEIAQRGAMKNARPIALRANDRPGLGAARRRIQLFGNAPREPGFAAGNAGQPHR